jgi:hypothetical protein
VVAFAVTFLAAGLAGAFGLLLLPGVVAIAWPAAASCAALGAMALGHVALRLADGNLPWTTAPQFASLALLAVLGAGAIRLSFCVPRGAEPRRPWLLLLPPAAGVALSLLALATAGGVDARGGEPVAGTLGLCLLGLGAGLLRLKPAWPRWAGAAPLAAALLVLLFLALGTERLRGSEPRIEWSRGTATMGASAALGGHGTLTSVSPSGRYFAQRELRDGGGPGAPWSYTVADFAGFRRQVPAQAFAFLSDEHALVLVARGAGAELRLEPIEGGAPLWSHPVPALLMPALEVDGTGRWSLVGAHRPSNGKVAVTGDRGGPAGMLTARTGRLFFPSAPMDRGLLVFRPERREAPPVTSALGLRGPPRWDVRLVETAGERRLGAIRGTPACSGPDGGRVVCQLEANRRAMLWAISGDGGMARLGAVPRDLDGHVLRGGVMAAVRPNDGEFVLIDVRARCGTRLRLPGLEYVHAAHPVPGGVVVQHVVGGTPTATVFRVAR